MQFIICINYLIDQNHVPCRRMNFRTAYQNTASTSTWTRPEIGAFKQRQHCLIEGVTHQTTAWNSINIWAILWDLKPGKYMHILYTSFERTSAMTAQYVELMHYWYRMHVSCHLELFDMLNHGPVFVDSVYGTFCRHAPSSLEASVLRLSLSVSETQRDTNSVDGEHWEEAPRWEDEMRVNVSVIAQSTSTEYN